MSETISNFNIFRDFPPNLKQNIKIIYVSKLLFEFGFCVLNDEEVYGFGEYIQQILGYNPNELKYVLVNELCDQNIQEFYQGYDCMFARNNQNEIFSWGRNNRGQLARGYKSDELEFLKPQKINYFDGKNIIHMKCGNDYCLAISSNFIIYRWGYYKGKIVTDPFVLETIDSIKFKYILNNSHNINSCVLFALTFDDIIYKREGDYKWNEFYNLNSTKEFIENNEEDILNEIIDLYVDDSFNNEYFTSDCKIVCQTTNSVYIFTNFIKEKTPYKTLFEYFIFEEQKTHKTILFEDNKYFALDFNERSNTSKLLMKTFKPINYSFEQNESNYSLRNFRISHDLPQILESNVKYYYQSRNHCFDSSDYFGFFITNDDKVYCIGNNSDAKLGLGHNEKIYECTEITALRNKNIEEFFGGHSYMFARNDKNEIFSWGNNSYGQLARGFQCDFMFKYLKPDKIYFFNDKNIINISCGVYHCFALSSDGRIFGWGNNSQGQIGCGEVKIVLTPIEINLEEKIKFVYCAWYMSFAVCFNGKGYFWGSNNGRDIFSSPKEIPLKNISKLYYYNEVLIILDNFRKVFIFNYLNNEINEIISEDFEEEIEFIDLYYENVFPYNNFLLKSRSSVYRLGDISDDKMKYKLIETNFKDFYSQISNDFNKTIEITKDGYLLTKQIQFNKKNKSLSVKNENVFKTKYEQFFEFIKQLGKGGFGIVNEVKKKSNQVHFAIKFIEIKEDLCLKEINLMSKKDTDFIVQYIDSWIEEIGFFGKLEKYLLIQMELCSSNLREIIGLMKITFEERFKIFYYFISCELFRELTECVDYLHSLTPPIIHRDLKPENILISDGINGRYLKLCDFGEAIVHQESIHTRMKGTLKYMAPEVLHSNTYNTKSDIYSLALISTEIFRFEDNIKTIRDHKESKDFGKYLSKYINTILETKFKQLLETLSNCLIPENYHSRFDCKQLLEKIKDFSINKNIVINDENIFEFKSFLGKQNTIFKKFYETKIEEK